VRAIPAPPPLWPAVLGVQRAVRDDLDLARSEGQCGGQRMVTAAAALGYHSLRAAGGALGARADRLPPALRRACSLEGRAGFHPLDVSA
jgi:hypothetical protein